MSLHIYTGLEQGTEEWLNVRRGIVTASVVGQLLTPTGKVAANDYSRALTATLAAERITGWTEPVYVNDDMMRGTLDEPLARDHYARHYAPVEEVGFMVEDKWGFRLGYSPDGLVGDKGLIEAKSRKPKKHLQTILANAVPAENLAQIHAGLLVSQRDWCDYISWCGGMPMFVKRVERDERWEAAILAAVEQFEANVAEMTALYEARTHGLPPTTRTDHFAEAVI